MATFHKHKTRMYVRQELLWFVKFEYNQKIKKIKTAYFFLLKFLLIYNDVIKYYRL